MSELRDKLRTFTERRYKTIPVEGIGDVMIQSITEAERTSILQRAENGHKGHINALLIAACVVNENRKRIYTESDQDIDEILRLDSRITTQLANAINEHVMPDDVEEIAKNSEQTHTGSTPSD